MNNGNPGGGYDLFPHISKNHPQTKAAISAAEHRGQYADFRMSLVQQMQNLQAAANAAFPRRPSGGAPVKPLPAKKGQKPPVVGK